MKNLLVLSMICGLGVGVSAVSSAQLFTENFAASNPSAGGFYTVGAGSSFTGDLGTWTAYGGTDSGPGSIDVVSGTYGVPGPNLGSGNLNWVDLAGTPGPGGISIALSPTYTPGAYTLGFYAISTNNYNLIQASVDSSAFVTSSPATTVNGVWTHYTESVTLGSGANYLNLYTADGSNGNDGVTNITLTASQPAPEPMQTVLAGAAGLVGFLVIRRRNA